MIERFDLAFLDARVHLVWVAAALVAAALTAARRRWAALEAFGVAPGRAREVTWRRHGRLALTVAALAALLFAALGPRANPERRTVQRKGRDLVVCLDVSRSMLAQDLKPSRLERAKLELTRLAERLTHERIALVLFAGDTVVRCPLTSNTSYFASALRTVGPTSVSQGGTLIGDAIRTALTDVLGHDLSRRSRPGGEADGAASDPADAPRVAALESYADVLVITDGEDHESYPVRAAALARELGVGVFAVGLGSREGALIPLPDGSGHVEHDGAPVRSAFDPALLLETVNAAGRGKLLPVATQHFDLVDFCQQAIFSGDGRLRDEEVVTWTEVYQPFAILGLALLLAAQAIPLGVAPLRAQGVRSAAPRAGAAAPLSALVAAGTLALGAPAQAQGAAPAPPAGATAASAEAPDDPGDVAVADPPSPLAPGEDPFEAGARAFRAGDFAAAAAAYEAGVDGQGRRALLCRYDAALARRATGDLDAAIAHLEPVSVQGTGALRQRATALLALCRLEKGERIAAAPSPEEAPPEDGAAPGDPIEAKAKRLVAAAAELRAAELLFERVTPPTDEAAQGQRVARLRRRELLAEVAALAREKAEAERRQRLADPGRFLLEALGEVRSERRALRLLQEVPPRRRRVPSRRIAKQEEARRELYEQLQFGLQQPPDPQGQAPGPHPGGASGPQDEEAQQLETQRRELAAQSLGEAIAASRQVEASARSLDPEPAVAAASRQVDGLRKALLLHPLDLAALTADLVAHQGQVVEQLASPRLLPKEQEEVAFLCQAYGAVQAQPAPDPGAAGPRGGGGGPSLGGAPALTEEVAAQIREKGQLAHEAASEAHRLLEAGDRDGAADPARTALALLEELQELLPKPPPSLAERVRELLAHEEELARRAEALDGLGQESRADELTRLAGEQQAHGERASELASEAQGAPPTKPAAEPLVRAGEAARQAGDAFEKDLADAGRDATGRAIEALREALEALQQDPDQQQQQGQDQQQQQDPQDRQQDPQQDQQQPTDAERLDPQQARRMMEEMDRERREEEARLFPGGSGRAVEKDW